MAEDDMTIHSTASEEVIRGEEENKFPPHRMNWIAVYGEDFGRKEKFLTRKTKPEELAKIDALYYWLGVTLLSSQEIEHAYYLLFENYLAPPEIYRLRSIFIFHHSVDVAIS